MVMDDNDNGDDLGWEPDEQRRRAFLLFVAHSAQGFDRSLEWSLVSFEAYSILCIIVGIQDVYLWNILHGGVTPKIWCTICTSIVIWFSNLMEVNGFRASLPIMLPEIDQIFKYNDPSSQQCSFYQPHQSSCNSMEPDCSCRILPDTFW